MEELTGNTWALDGAGTVLSVKTGGIVRHASGGSGQIAIGAGNTGNPATLSVDGGSVTINANNCGFNIASGASGVAGTLTLNSGTVSMPAGTTTSLAVGTQAGNIGTLNLNGGTLSVAQVRKGAGAISTNNFNGGTLRAVNANFASTFLTGLDRANVRNGGAVVDSGAFAITIGQAFVHSDIAGDSATDGGLTKLGTGTLTLTGVNTYTGTSTVSNGTLAVGGSIKGPVVVPVGGTLSGGPAIGPISISNSLTLGGKIVMRIDKSPGVSSDTVRGVTALTYGGTLTLTVSGGSLAEGDILNLFQANSYSGAFTKITTVPALPINLGFDTSGLLTNGSLRVVVNSNSLPVLSHEPTALGLQLSWPTLPLYQFQLKTSTDLTNRLTNWANLGPCILGNGDWLSQVVTNNLPKQFFSLLAMPLPIDSSRLPAELWKDTQWNDPGGWTTINVTTQGLPANNASVDASAQIVAIINSTSGKRRLYFPTGTYYFKTPFAIHNNNLWFDGDGASNTVFSIDAPGSDNVQLVFSGSSLGSPVPVVGSLAAGDTTITLSNASAFVVGDIFQLYADNAPLTNGGQAFTSEIYFQNLKVTAINGNTLTLDMKVLLDYPASYTPTVQRFRVIQNVKLSRVKIVQVNQPTLEATYNFGFFYPYNCVVSQVESSFAGRDHFKLQDAKDCLIESNYVHDCWVHNTGGYGYGFTLVSATGCRLSNNKTTNLRHHYVISGCHNVVSYNAVDICYDYNDVAFHASYAYMNLIEGNMFTESYADTSKDGWTDVEPTTGPGNTWFRNYASGKVGSLQSQTKQQNVIGNAVGTLVTSGSDHYMGANIVAGVNKTYPSSWTGGTTNWGVFSPNVVLPASLYLTNRPVFFKSTTPWPVFGPGVTNWGVTNVIPARVSIPAGA